MRYRFAIWALAVLAAPVGSSAGSLDPAANATLAGRVFWDRDGDGVFSAADEPLPGVRVLSTSGEEAITDARGNYHLDLQPAGFEIFGDMALKLDPATLPAGTTGAERRFLSLTPGSLGRADFALRLGFDEPAGLDPPASEPAGGLLPAGDGSLARQWVARPPEGCRLYLGGELLAADADGRVRKILVLHPGANRFLVVMQCSGQRAEMFLQDVVWIHRSRGGDLVVPAGIRRLATCRAPFAHMPAASSALLGCRPEKGVRIRVGEAEFGGPKDGARLIPLVRGENVWPVRVFLADGEVLDGELRADVQATGVSGVLLGNLSASIGIGSDSGLTLGGKLDGALEASLPRGFKLILGGNYYPFDAKGLSTSDLLRHALLPAFTPWRRDRAPDLGDGYLEFADEGRLLAKNPSLARYYLELSWQASFLGVGQFELRRNPDGGVGTISRFSHGVYGELHPAEWWGGGRNCDFSLEGFYGVPLPAQGLPLPPGEAELGQLRPAPAHEEFLATGGTLYFLSHRWLAEGGLRLSVERRDRFSGARLERRELVPGRDFQVDAASGRVVLFRPLDPGNLSGEALRLYPAGQGRVVLVADYEYLEPDPDLPSQSVIGSRSSIKARIGENLRLEGSLSGLSELGTPPGIDPYGLLAGELSASLGRHVRLRAAYGRSQGIFTLPGYSTDGGLSFYRPDRSARQDGEAYSADLLVDTERVDVRAGFSRYLAGYSDSARLASVDVTAAWLESEVGFEKIALFARGAGGDAAGRRAVFGTLGARFLPVEKLSLTAQAGLDVRRISAPDLPVFGLGEGARVLAGLRASYRLFPWLGVSATHQQNLWRQGEGSAGRDLTMTFAGVDLDVPGGFAVGVEGGFGPEAGNLMRLNLARDRDGEGAFVRADIAPGGDLLAPRTLSIGQSAPLGRGMVYRSGDSFRQGSSLGALERLGLAVPLAGHLVLDLSWERAEVAGPASYQQRVDLADAPFADRGVLTATAPGRRNAVFGALSWRSDRLALRGTAEYRVDEHAPPPEGLFPRPLSTLRQALFSAAGRLSLARGLALSARAAFGESFGEQADGTGMTPRGGMLEASAGLAFRPPDIDWVWLLARVAGGRDLRPEMARQGRRAEIWWLGSLAVHLRPIRFFQPTLVLAPVWESQPLELPGGRRYLEIGSLLSMVRIGSEIWRGLGIAGELRGRYGFSTEVSAQPLPARGFSLGGAAEAFYMFSADSGDLLRLGIGFSFSDLPDPLSDLRNGREGVFIRLEGML